MELGFRDLEVARLHGSPLYAPMIWGEGGGGNYLCIITYPHVFCIPVFLVNLVDLKRKILCAVILTLQLSIFYRKYRKYFLQQEIANILFAERLLLQIFCGKT